MVLLGVAAQRMPGEKPQWDGENLRFTNNEGPCCQEALPGSEAARAVRIVNASRNPASKSGRTCRTMVRTAWLRSFKPAGVSEGLPLNHQNDAHAKPGSPKCSHQTGHG